MPAVRSFLLESSRVGRKAARGPISGEVDKRGGKKLKYRKGGEMANKEETRERLIK